MKKIALAVIMSAFAVTAMSAPVLAAKKKAAPGKCGTMMYFDKKSKACKSKG
ncbi:MAG: hypothetical protein ABL907_02060 [Hyphomicrobium sp.]